MNTWLTLKHSRHRQKYAAANFKTGETTRLAQVLDPCNTIE
jgi:hypothetical protein